MKKRYIAPEMEVVCFECENIITTSNETPFVPFSTNEENWIPTRE